MKSETATETFGINKTQLLDGFYEQNDSYS